MSQKIIQSFNGIFNQGVDLALIIHQAVVIIKEKGVVKARSIENRDQNNNYEGQGNGW